MAEKIAKFLEIYNELPDEASVAAHAFLEGLEAGCKIRELNNKEKENDSTESA